ncbi:MAG: hypothetical protein GY777_27745, partial [Candidatus Brocadiaceae bacterium]|nr:hypothetical protein [Candidatus Brocadiaceae bacterium]
KGPDDVTLTHNYDAAGRLSTINIPGQGDITYDNYKWDSPSKITLPGGSTTDYTYDALWQVKKITTRDPDSSEIMTRNYVYSKEGNIESKETEHGIYTYEYDDLYRLTDAVNPAADDEEYDYDALGNRIRSAAVGGVWNYNLNNELEDYGSTTLTHDNNGNITIKRVGTDDTTYVYDEGDRMVEVLDDNSNPIAVYYYDPFGRRLWKNDGNGGRTYYLYSDEGLIGEYDSNGLEIKTYGYAIGSQWGTNPLYQKVGADYYWYHNDHQGTPQKITKTDGEVVWSATYDSFGKTTVSDTSTITNNLRFAGQYFDAETGLHYNWNRYYDPETGRYMRVDPVGEGLNLYLYVQNNPLKYIDPRGLRQRSNNSYQSSSVSNNLFDTKPYDFVGNSTSSNLEAEINRNRYSELQNYDAPEFSAPFSSTRTGKVLQEIGTHGFGGFGGLIGKTGTSLAARSATSKIASGLVNKVTNYAKNLISKVLPSSKAYRYVGPVEAKIAENSRVVPNVTQAGKLKNVFYSPKRYTSATIAEDALKIGKNNPLGATTTPTHRITVDASKIKWEYRGNVDGAKGIELITREQSSLLRIDTLGK